MSHQVKSLKAFDSTRPPIPPGANDAAGAFMGSSFPGESVDWSHHPLPWEMIFWGTRWAPTSYKWSYSPYKWPYKWVTGVITPTSGVITLLISGMGPTLELLSENNFSKSCFFLKILWNPSVSSLRSRKNTRILPGSALLKFNFNIITPSEN